jgi:hypothetical protein
LEHASELRSGVAHRRGQTAERVLGHWAVSEAGTYFLDFEADPRPTVKFYSFATRRVSPVFTLEKQPCSDVKGTRAWMVVPPIGFE